MFAALRSVGVIDCIALREGCGRGIMVSLSCLELLIGSSMIDALATIADMRIRGSMLRHGHGTLCLASAFRDFILTGLKMREEKG